MTQLPTTVVISPDALHQVVEGEAVLFHLTRQCYYSLDDVGSRIWSLLVVGENPEAIVAILLDEYDTTEPVLRADVGSLLNRLGEAGLIELTP